MCLSQNSAPVVNSLHHPVYRHYGIAINKRLNRPNEKSQPPPATIPSRPPETAVSPEVARLQNSVATGLRGGQRRNAPAFPNNGEGATYKETTLISWMLHNGFVGFSSVTISSAPSAEATPACNASRARYCHSSRSLHQQKSTFNSRRAAGPHLKTSRRFTAVARRPLRPPSNNVCLDYRSRWGPTMRHLLQLSDGCPRRRQVDFPVRRTRSTAHSPNASTAVRRRRAPLPSRGIPPRARPSPAKSRSA